MAKFNLVIGVLAFISGILNIIVGIAYNSQFYTQLDLILASTQVVLSALMALTTLAKLDVIIKNKLIKSMYLPAGVAFYFYAVTVLFMFSPMFHD